MKEPTRVACGFAILALFFVAAFAQAGDTFEVTGARQRMVPFAEPALSNAGLIPDVPGASAAPLAAPVPLPYEKALPGPVTDYAIMTARSDWGKEYLLECRRLPDAGFRFVQKQGRSCANLKPWLAVWNVKTGRGVMVLLAWSGNWSLEVQPRGGETVLRADTSPSGLKPFDSVNGLPLPGALVSEFTGHWDYGTQPIARFIRAKLLRDLGHGWPPVQYNTWYATEANFDEKQLLDSARVAAEVGCELFTVDAGWYGGGAKTDWSQSVGNWEVNRERLPNGLEAVAAEARRLGMKFGLWVEIECAAPTSPVGKAHPDWFLRQGDRFLSDRAGLNFGKPEALAWATSVIDRLVTAYRLDYLKMDFNTDLPVDGGHLAPEADPLYGHYRGLVGLWKHLRSAHPKLIVENCSSGSLRQDALTAALTDTHWVSDNVDNGANLAMNYGATALFPPEICSHWTCYPSARARNDPGPAGALDLETQFTVNMMGHLGLSGRIYEWDAETRKVGAERIALYKKIRPLLRTADVFHLTPQVSAMSARSTQATLYVDPKSGQALLFAFQGGDPALQVVLRLRGLMADRMYRVEWLAAFGAEQSVSGKKLLEEGLTVRFPHRGASVIVPIDP